jgi:hypothetical protein
VKKFWLYSIFGPNPIFLLRGGIGNQLFIYSAAVYLGKRQSFTPVFQSQGIDHGESISEMGLPGKFMGKFQSKVYTLDRKLNQRISNRALQVLPTSNALSHEPINIIARSYVSGYFQTADYASHLKANGYFDEFIRKEPKAALAEKYFEIINSNATIMHLRFGDYLGATVSLGNLAPKYYESVFASDNEVSANPIYVMSDDFHLAREYVKEFPGLDFRILDKYDGLSSIDLMKLFGSADRVICANSTYSWWGAFLSSRAQKIWAPCPWFRDHDLAVATSRIYPMNFRKVASIWK